MTMNGIRKSWIAIGLVAVVGCKPGGGDDSTVAVVTFSPIDPSMGDTLTQAEVDLVIQAAAEAIDAPNLAIAVTDRIGNILRVWNRNPASLITDCDNRIAPSIARAAAYLSHSQAPLTSRTGQFISTFHFPAVFDLGSFDPALGNDCAPLRPTIGVGNTPQGPLWQIDASNRGAPIASAATNPPTLFDPGQEIPQLVNPAGDVPSPGLTALPGGVPLYKRTSSAQADPGLHFVERRLVGAIGAYVTDASGNPVPEAAEFAAVSGAVVADPATNEPYFPPFAVPKEGGVYLVGVLLPALEQVSRPSGFGPGTYDPSLTIFNSGFDGQADPFDWLISPVDSANPLVPFTAAEVETIILSCVDASLKTHAAIRLPSRSACRMIITVTDIDDVILGCYRMEDATLFSLEISITKARNSVYFSNPGSLDASGPRAGKHPLDGIVPAGTAITCRTLGFLSQPFFPPGIQGSGVKGPLFNLALENRMPSRFNQMGFAPPGAYPDTQSGIIFFPGSAPLYRDGKLIGGLGVSGDGVEQDDFVTDQGIKKAQKALGFELEPPASIRCDQFSFRGVRLPYFKFPQHPQG